MCGFTSLYLRCANGFTGFTGGFTSVVKTDLPADLPDLPPSWGTDLPDLPNLPADLPDLPPSSKRIYRTRCGGFTGFTGFTSVVKTDLPDLPKRIYRIYLRRQNGFTTLKTDLPDLPPSWVAQLTTPIQLFSDFPEVAQKLPIIVFPGVTLDN